MRIIRDIRPPRVHAVPLPIEEGFDAPPPLSLQMTVTPAAVAQGWETNQETKGETKEKESGSPTVSALKSTLLILSVALKGVAITVSRPPLGGGRAPGTSEESKGRRVEESKNRRIVVNYISVCGANVYTMDTMETQSKSRCNYIQCVAQNMYTGK